MNISKRTRSLSILLSIIMLLSLLTACSVAPDAIGVQDTGSRAVIDLNSY